MTLHLSTVVTRSAQDVGDASSIRQFRHTDFSQNVSPLVLVDHFVMTGPTFNPHPHAGISAITLLLEDSDGAMRSLDNVRNNGEFGAGDLHWTLAGKGIVHTQYPVGEARLHGLHIFVNLPESLKTLPPSTAVLKAGDMPMIQSHTGRIRVAAGSYGGRSSPLQTPEPLLILDGWLRPGATTVVPLPAGWNAWIYAVQGSLGVRARHCGKQITPLPRTAGRDPDFAVLAEGSAIAASACPQGEEGVLLLIADKVSTHFVLVAGPAKALSPSGATAVSQAPPEASRYLRATA